MEIFAIVPTCPEGYRNLYECIKMYRRKLILNNWNVWKHKVMYEYVNTFI